ncbi:MAG TPA: hypothetical protein VG276_11050 [Actinomycetes bacterium]|jgi:hypothetical protein|nr:hypothetical protein [Actinomycetes bacterium]
MPVQWTSGLGIEVKQACVDGIEFELAVSAERPAAAAGGGGGGGYDPTTAATQLIVAVTPPPLRTDASTWDEAMAPPQVGSVIWWHAPQHTPKLRQPGGGEREVLRESVELAPDPGPIDSAGAQYYELLGCPSGPYEQLPAGPVTTTHRATRTYRWAGGDLNEGDQVAISFEDFDPDRLSVDWIVLVQGGRLVAGSSGARPTGQA